MQSRPSAHRWLLQAPQRAPPVEAIGSQTVYALTLGSRTPQLKPRGQPVAVPEASGSHGCVQ